MRRISKRAVLRAELARVLADSRAEQKVNGSFLTSREELTVFPGEAEAMVESLKTGWSWFVLSECRGIHDFSGRKPQLGREAVRGPKSGQ